MQDHPLQQARKTNVWYPFDGLGEWSLAKFLDELFFYMQLLPGRGPKWQCTKLKLKGYESEQPIHLIWRDGLEHQIGEFWTSDDAWKIQDQLPEGATIILIIAASDKTPVTRHTGGLEMHLLFLTIGNIQADVHMKATSHACLWHKCMDLVCSNLKVAAHVGEYMVDPSARLCHHIDPWDLIVFLREAKKLHLSGVHLPFWRNWRHSNPASFLMPEILHMLHKFFFDHVLKWIKQIMGHELDVQFKSHHKHTGVRHFSGGHRDIQCMIVPMLWGMASPGFIRAVQAMIDFIYLTQNPLHTESSIVSMTQALRDFHCNKQAILDAEAQQGKSGAKDNFFILKLELMQSFARAIFHVSSLMQWTADMSERLLITHCKHPFERTSHQQDFVLQIARILNWEETIQLFNLYTLLSSFSSTPGQDPLINAVVEEDKEITSTETDPTLAWVSNVNPAAQLSLQGPRPVCNHFLKGIISDNAWIAFNVTVKADHSCLDASQLQSLYHLPDFAHALHLYATRNGCTLPDHVSFNTWLKFRIQLHSAFHTCRIMPSQQIHAKPPSSNFPRGNCDAVLFSQRVDGDKDGSYVAQIRAIFQPILPRGSHAQLPEHLQPYTGHPSQSETVIRRGSIIPLTDITHAVEIIPVY
ncbi:hypothetical protein F4604DRAFT_1880626 [Suillus subluteus]|nr:hypothetical protein F4604DRAFT_1880626 [Suillus subluteus]